MAHNSAVCTSRAIGRSVTESDEDTSLRHYLYVFSLVFAVQISGGVTFAQRRAAAKTEAYTAVAELPAAYQGPARINLSGEWDFRFDPDAHGEGAAWFEPDAAGPWKKAKVPGSYNVEFAHHPDHPEPNDSYLFYKGKAWYRTRFQCPRTPQDLFLHLSGTVLRQKVWINGHLVGSSALPWLDVAYDISNLVTRNAENTLVIEVDNSILPEAIPDAKWRGWWDDGGLIWPVYLEERPAVRAQTYASTTMSSGKGWRLTVNSHIHADSQAKATLELKLTDDHGKEVWQKVEEVPNAGLDSELHSSTILDGIQPWSPENPVLYRLAVRVNSPSQPSDITWFRIGFRQIEAEGSQILLNGKPITLRGVNRHEFASEVGQSVSPAQNLRDLQDIKSLGTNFVRLTHYSQSQDVYDDCDELGLLVWTEIPAWQSTATTLASPAVWKDDAAPQLERMIQQHRNHPSIVIWSVANEIPSDKPEVAGYVTRAIDYVHQLDPDRLVTFASDKRERDVSMSNEDIVSVNEYFGWYYGGLDDVGPMLDSMHAKYPGKPILVSEFGAEAVADWDSRTAKAGSKDYSYAYQAKFLSTQLKQIYAPQRQSYVAGGAIWIYNDFPDPHRIDGDHPDVAKYRNSKGLVTMDRVPKPAYTIVKNFYHELMHTHAKDAAQR